MICKFCRRQIVDNSIFCSWCGEKQIKEKKISVPKPRKKADGTYSGQIMVKGQRMVITGKSIAQYEAKARAAKTGAVELPDGCPNITLKQAIESYMESSSAVLSPSTLRGYNIVLRNRFSNYMGKKIGSIDWQTMVNEEAALVAPKTVINGWGLVSVAVKAAGGKVPDKINKPKQPAELDLPWLDEDQLKIFLEKVRGEEIEFVALAALHSLRESEILALLPGSVTENGIKVRGSVVPDKDNKLIRKDTNKTKLSTRDIPILIPRILEVIPDADHWHIPTGSNIRRDINRICEKAGLPEVGCQGLRRTFAGMAYRLGWSETHTMAVGGWSNTQTIHRFYLRLSQKEKDVDVKKMRKAYEKMAK